jgi:hypothetical protein
VHSRRVTKLPSPASVRLVILSSVNVVQHCSPPPVSRFRRLLEQAQSDLQAGRFVYRPPWAQDGGGRTGHSAASSLAAFLTPGVLDERRSAATLTAVSSGAAGGVGSGIGIGGCDTRQWLNPWRLPAPLAVAWSSRLGREMLQG